MTWLPLLAETHDKLHIPLEWGAIVVGSLCTVIGVLYRAKTRAEARERKLLREVGGLAADPEDRGDG